MRRVKVGLFIGFSLDLGLFYTGYNYHKTGLISQAFFNQARLKQSKKGSGKVIA